MRQLNFKFSLIAICTAILCNVEIYAANYTVTNTADSGEGSLRQAMTSATSNYMGSSNIYFNIPTTDANYNAETGTFTIDVMSELPYLLIGGNINIDATTQTSNVGDTNPYGPEIILDGGNRNLMSCFRIASANNSIKGFAIGGFQYAFLFFGANGGLVSNCNIGVNATGDAAFTNPNSYGIGISGGSYGSYDLGYARNITITDNIISGNTIAGIALIGVSENTISGNKIGTDRTATVSIPNNQGIYISSASHDNTIGGNTETSRNILSGNTNAAIVMESSGSRNNVIIGNYIGTDNTGSNPLSNHYGIIVMTNANSNRIGGTTPSERNIISANTEIGIYIESADSNVVCGNYIGTDVTGTQAFSFEGTDSLIQANGVEINTTGKHNIIGGNNPEERNIISGNRVYGCIYYGNCHHNNICGNYIGTDVTGEIAIPNATGICVDGSSHQNIMENNVLSGNRSYGLFIVTRGTDENIFRGNLVGTNAAGTTAIPNDVGLMLAADAKNNIIGGDNASDRNLFSGNIYAGIEVTDLGTENNIIKGNYIGVDITGNSPLPNDNGIIVSALTKHLEINNNIISANNNFGLVITDQADSISVFNNKIGTGHDISLDLGNGASGILIAGGASDNFIGGENIGNIIANNDSAGIVLMDETTINNRISQNSIFNNQYAGIEIFPQGINRNDSGDADDGCNRLMNFPEITSVIRDVNSGLIWIEGNLDTQNPQHATVELFIAHQQTGIGIPREGRTYIGQTTPHNDGSWFAVLNAEINSDETIIATATDGNGNTSEFSESHGITTKSTPIETQELSAYPNPTNGICEILTNTEPQNISIYNAIGQQIKQAKISNGNRKVTIDLSGLAAGTYIIVIDNTYLKVNKD
ncbi:MAG: T9SS type A sorting domain-containing protein [Bacteroidales bacterium]|nr:T9SS type A sorting domain-containing protein [Bacteroidales bacterium]